MQLSGWPICGGRFHSFSNSAKNARRLRQPVSGSSLARNLQLVVLPADLVARLLQLVEHVLELLVLLFDRGHVVESGQCAASASRRRRGSAWR